MLWCDKLPKKQQHASKNLKQFTSSFNTWWSHMLVLAKRETTNVQIAD
jgi:hypothetical protein